MRSRPGPAATAAPRSRRGWRPPDTTRPPGAAGGLGALAAASGRWRRPPGAPRWPVHRESMPRARSFTNRGTIGLAAASGRAWVADGGLRARRGGRYIARACPGLGRSRIAKRWGPRHAPHVGSCKPRGDLAERGRVDLVEQPTTVQAEREGTDQASLLEQPQLSGHGRAAELELSRDGRGPSRLHGDQGDDGAACRIRQEGDSRSIASCHSGSMTPTTYPRSAPGLSVRGFANERESSRSAGCPPRLGASAPLAGRCRRRGP
jgi:hypothetical protein